MICVLERRTCLSLIEQRGLGYEAVARGALSFSRVVSDYSRTSVAQQAKARFPGGAGILACPLGVVRELQAESLQAGMPALPGNSLACHLEDRVAILAVLIQPYLPALLWKR